MNQIRFLIHLNATSAATFLLLAAICIGCHDNGYRTVATPGEEGRYDIGRVPEDPRTVSRRQAEAAVSSDPKLVELNNKWRYLSP